MAYDLSSGGGIVEPVTTEVNYRHKQNGSIDLFGSSGCLCGSRGTAEHG